MDDPRYAIGMGTGTVALVLFPLYLITGEAVMGLASDIVAQGRFQFESVG